MPHFDFDMPADTRKEPVTFSLMGEQFTAAPEAPAGTLADLLLALRLDDFGNRVYDPAPCIRFVMGILLREEEMTADAALGNGIPVDLAGNKIEPGEQMVRVRSDNVDRFSRLLYDPDHPLHTKPLGEMVVQLREYYEGRPTVSPAG